MRKCESRLAGEEQNLTLTSILTTKKLIKAANILDIPIYATTQNRARLGETCTELNIPSAVEHADKSGRC